MPTRMAASLRRGSFARRPSAGRWGAFRLRGCPRPRGVAARSTWSAESRGPYCRSMGRVYEGIDDRLAAWLSAQHVFFVATAPVARDGHVNISPKGGRDTLVVLDPNRVAYLDL